MTFERSIGWVVVIFYVGGILAFCEWFESIDLATPILAILFFPLAWIWWLGLMLIHEKFDIFGDRRR